MAAEESKAPYAHDDIPEGAKASKREKEKSIWTSALSNLSVQYNFAVIAIVLKIMDDKYAQTDWIKEMLKGIVFAGAITGQLMMGYVGDYLGRNKGLCITIFLAGFGALASAVFPWGNRWSIYAVIAVARFILGVGVGGVYPLSATKAAEESATSDKQARNLRVSLAFFWQTPGAILPYVFALIVVYAFNDVEVQFRILLALGAIPSIPILYHTMGVKDNSEFRKDKTNTLSLLQKKENWIKLIATGGCWMIYDIVYYGTALFSPTITDKIFNSKDDIVKESWQNIVVSSAGIPAIILGIWSQQRFGTKPVQVWGFVFIAVMFILIGVVYHPLKDSKWTLFGLYLVLMFSLNYGPNITTFILPAEVYPPKIRSTMNGISAALGKVGAIIGTFIYQPIYDAFGLGVLMVVAGIIALLGAVLSTATVPTDNYDNLGNYEVIEVQSSEGPEEGKAKTPKSLDEPNMKASAENFA